MRRAGCLLIVVLGALAAGYWMVGARQRVLDGAVATTRATFAAPVATARSDSALQAALSRFMSTKGRGLAYLTLRDAQGRVLASDGVWPLAFHDVLSPATARVWRAWIYRTLCAERVSVLTDASGAAVGRVRLGIAWWRVLRAAGPLAWLASGLSLIGLIGLWREVPGRRRKSTAGSDGGTSGPGSSGRRSGPSRGGPFRRLRDAPPRNDEFTPINGPAGTQTKEARNRSAAPRPAAESRPAMRDDVGRRNHDGATAAPAEAPVTDRAPSGTPVRPDLRLLPVWWGVRGGLLAGGLVRLECAVGGEWRSLSVAEWAEVVADRLAPADAMNSLARRLAALQDHWRGLEHAVPRLIIPVPDAWIADASLSELWPRLAGALGVEGRSLVLCAPAPPKAADEAPGLRWATADTPARARDRLRLVFPGMTRAPASPVEELILSDAAPVRPGAFARLALTHDGAIAGLTA